AKGFKTGWTPSSTATAVYIIAVPNDDPSAIPIATVVSGNYPNPFNPTTTIEYSIKNPSHVIMGVYNSRGALVKMLVDAQKTPGFYQIAWNGEDNSGNEVSSGVYFIVLKADSVISSRKMLMMK
ncbi:MAG TPA: FlgD immunoglobulin-like domain containing protein, partial [Candidatus Cloacimonadota bacterium]|nr:FlgD immunoglobulin-like domain containing protein [Candidatus Cloacimonadota bacterium]